LPTTDGPIDPFADMVDNILIKNGAELDRAHRSRWRAALGELIRPPVSPRAARRRARARPGHPGRRQAALLASARLQPEQWRYAY
jgi:hypothetical protein